MAQYVKISKLSPITGNMQSNDMFLVSRENNDPSNDDKYDSRSLTYGKLSSDVFEKTMYEIQNSHAVIFNALSTVNDMNVCREGGTRIVQENCAYQLKQKIDNIGGNSGNFLRKDTQDQQYVNGPVTFNSKVQSKQYPEGEDDVANKKYVDDILGGGGASLYTFSISRKKPSIEKSFYVVNNTSTAQGDAIKQNDTIPIVAFINSDGMYQIQILLRRVQNSMIGLYTFDTETTDEQTIRQEIKTCVERKNFDSFSAVSIVDFMKEGTIQSFATMCLPLRKGCILCFFAHVNVSSQEVSVPHIVAVKWYNRSLDSQHLSQPESYTDCDGYYFHYEKYKDDKGRDKFRKVYDLDSQGAKYLKTEIQYKNITKVVIIPDNSRKFVLDTTINIYRYVN